MIPRRAAVFALLASLAAGCEGLGDAALFSNPLLARMAALSEEEAAALPLPERYRWAYLRFTIEASDLERGVRWRNAAKVVGSVKRACGYLNRMFGMLEEEKARKDAAGAIEAYAKLGNAVSGGRWFRSALAAAEDLRAGVEETLDPSVVKLRGIPDAGGAPQEDGARGEWTVVSKREVLEESGEGKRTRYLLALEGRGGGKREQEVGEEEFRSAKVGEAWPAESGTAEEQLPG